MNAYYVQNVLGKRRKDLILHKVSKQAKFDNTHKTSFASYKTLANRINNVDIGQLRDISGLSTSHEKVYGKYSNPASYIVDLAKLYLEGDYCREDKLKTSSFLFAMAIAVDAAPVMCMAMIYRDNKSAN